MSERKKRQIIIVGGGSSINEGIKKGLWNKLKNKYTIGLNYSYKYLKSTFQSFVDRKFYQDEINNMLDLPLIIGQKHKLKIYKNTILLPVGNTYTRDLSKGVYKGSLVGIFALSLAIHLLDEGEIFLLGYDFGKLNNEIKDKRWITHFYQGEIRHRGIGKINYYEIKNRANVDFGVYKDEKKIKIYNVSPKSKIEVFEKLDYDQFFFKLDNKIYDQDKLREEIKQKLC